MYPLLGGWSAACAVALRLVIMLYFHPSGLESSSDGGRGLELLITGLPSPNAQSEWHSHPCPSPPHRASVTPAMNIRPSPSTWGWPFPLDDRSPRLQVDKTTAAFADVVREGRQVDALLQTVDARVRSHPKSRRRFIAFQKRSRRNMNNKPDVQQRDILTEATVGRAQTDFWLPPSSNAIGPESSRSATFKMPSTLLHLAWIRQLAVRWLNPPVVDVLGRGAYTSPLTRAGHDCPLVGMCILSGYLEGGEETLLNYSNSLSSASESEPEDDDRRRSFVKFCSSTNPRKIWEKNGPYQRKYTRFFAKNTYRICQKIIFGPISVPISSAWDTVMYIDILLEGAPDDIGLMILPTPDCIQPTFFVSTSIAFDSNSIDLLNLFQLL
ncbi:hypothetical protein B0H13DRAFT_1862151 [Mycena leptocephala]|nr:hypothetical protein B0H13DRAFT_1862151 [Mycena leptocephala]